MYTCGSVFSLHCSSAVPHSPANRIIHVCLQVKVEGDDVIVKADKKALADTHRPPIACGSKPDQDSRVFVIVGGGELKQSPASAIM
jgi:hypothetical protein